MRVVSVLALAALAAPAWAACPPSPNRTVCAGGSCTDLTIAAAITNVPNNGTICVRDPVTFAEKLDFGGKNVTLVGDAPGAGVSTGAGSEIVALTGIVTIRDFDVAGNNVRRCIKVHNGGSLTLDGVRVHGCVQPISGAGIFLQNNGGGATLVLRDSELDGNGAAGFTGGAVFGDRSVRVEAYDTRFHHNVGTDGAAVRLEQTTGTFEDCEFSDNTATGLGGGLRTADAPVNVRRGLFRANTAATGGGYYHSGNNAVTFEDTDFDANRATGDGGAVAFAGSGLLTLLGGAFTGNAADSDLLGGGDGGALRISSGSLSLEAALLSGNSAWNGGGIRSSIGSFTITSADVFGNTARSDGGGLYLSGGQAGAELLNTVVAANTCAGVGGGLRTLGSTFLARNNVFVDNDCTGPDDGDGVFHETGTLSFVNNIVAHQADEGFRLAVGALVAHSHNDWFANGQNVGTGSIGVTDLTADPDFASWDGDAVWDDSLLVLPGSPCIDAGDGGYLDPDGSPSDIGIGGGPQGRVDVDGDGWVAPLDCDDADDAVYPDAPEVPADGIDQDCDGFEDCYEDLDGDLEGDPLTSPLVPSAALDCLVVGLSPDPVDCDDSDDTVFTGATELPADRTDQDCDGDELCYVDADHDGYGTSATAPVSVLTCAVVGFTEIPGDCSDASGSVRPGAPESVNDGIDQDCDGVDTCYLDNDDDGYGIATQVDSTNLTCTGVRVSGVTTDCNDGDAAIRPGATETAGDEIDSNCDGRELCYTDGDGDLHGGATTALSTDADCRDAGEYRTNTDCNDAVAQVYVGAPELPANNRDDDCAGGELCYTDVDGDDFGVAATVASTNLSCADAGEAPNQTDCDDRAGAGAAVHPGAPEGVNNGVDNDCDGFERCFADGDHDGFGTSTTVQSSNLVCTDLGESTLATDCDDGNAQVSPDGTERVGDQVDGDCDTDELCYTDLDGDGHAGTGARTSDDLDCTDAGEFRTADDCNDNVAQVFPGAPELPANSRDDDCAGGELCYADDDGDHYGTSATTASTDLDCADAGEAPTDDDCDDRDPQGTGIHPGAAEVRANGVDEDCDGADLVDCYVDDDDDGYGTLETRSHSGDCDPAPHLSDQAGDCDDDDAGIHPGQAEPLLGDGIDTDCDQFGRPLDEDEDGLPYDDEVAAGSSDGDDDTDGDGIGDAPEVAAGTDPARTDTDADGVPDGEEWGTGVTPRDSDADGLVDPDDEDDDADGLPTAVEIQFYNVDVDGDRLLNWVDDDDDGDGLPTAAEDADGDGDVTNDDADGDGLADYIDGDDDEDGVPTLLEVLAGADPFDPDSDDDTVADGDEWPDRSLDPPDTDGDGSPDLTDPDDDDDAIDTAVELDPLNRWTDDVDEDGHPNHVDDDADGDGRRDVEEGTTDDDLDGVPNFADPNDEDGCTGDDDFDGALNCLDTVLGRRGDPDADGDLVPDGVELDLEALGIALAVDQDLDGIADLPDLDDPAVVAALDPDGDGDLAPRDDDDDGDGIPTRVETGYGTTVDDDGDPCTWLACAANTCPGAGVSFDFRGNGTIACDDGTSAPLDLEAWPGFHGADAPPDWLQFDPSGLADTDGDCVVDDRDPMPDGPDADFDGDGFGNAFECRGRDDGSWDPLSDDTDGDGVGDASEGGRDTDGDGLDDQADPDDDGDGVPTVLEGTGDADGDGIPDFLEADADGDGIADGAEEEDADCDGILDRTDPVDDARCERGPGASLQHARQGCSCDQPGAPAGLVAVALATALALGRRRR